jgi:hypothetical protein
MSLAPAETSCWSYPQLFNSQGTLLKLTRKVLKEDLFVLNDGLQIVAFFSSF